jgi:protein-S-isoprenylcysteine O-methyltransferase Ste14
LGFASLLFLRVYPDVLLTFSCPFDLLLQLIGMALLVAGMFGAWWAIASLGEFNAPRWARLKQGHAVIKTGAYRYLRHPLYASRMIAYLGVFLFFENFLLLLIFLSTVLLLYLQARSEEKLLSEVFRGEYKSYQAATGMFLPRVLTQWIRRVRVAMLWKRARADEKFS